MTTAITGKYESSSYSTPKGNNNMTTQQAIQELEIRGYKNIEVTKNTLDLDLITGTINVNEISNFEMTLYPDHKVLISKYYSSARWSIKNTKLEAAERKHFRALLDK